MEQAGQDESMIILHSCYNYVGTMTQYQGEGHPYHTDWLVVTCKGKYPYNTGRPNCPQ